jgi:hypothetical protein
MESPLVDRETDARHKRVVQKTAECETFLSFYTLCELPWTTHFVCTLCRSLIDISTLRMLDRLQYEYAVERASEYR